MQKRKKIEDYSFRYRHSHTISETHEFRLHVAQREHSCRIGEDTLIFDCGPGGYHRMMEAGVRSTQLTHIFLSHLHYDHWLDYQSFVLTHWGQGAGKVPDLRVLGPTPLARFNDQLFGQDGVLGPDLTARTQHQLSLVRLHPNAATFYPAHGPYGAG